MLIFDLSEDEQWLVLRSWDQDVEKKQIELSLTRKIKNFYFHPLVKKKLWDGAICFVDKKGSIFRVGVGLWAEIYKVCEEYRFKVQINGLEKIIDYSFTLEDFTSWVNEFFKDGDPERKPRDYQIETAWKVIKYRYSVSEIATSSGKTLIAFMIIAYLMQKNLIKKFLMIVPNSNLIIQGTDDFMDYGLSKIKGAKIGQLGGGNKVREGSNIIIGTFQSLVKMDPEFFQDVDAIFIDEAHFTNTVSIKSIIAKALKSRWRFGLTGTLVARDSADFLTIQQYLGPVLVEIPPKFLFDNKYATPVHVKIIKMDWMDQDTKEKLYKLRTDKSTAKMDGKDLYLIEKRIILESERRLEFIVNMMSRSTKNSLVLFHSVKEGYGKSIYNSIREKDGKKELFYVDGGTDEGLRDEYKTRMKSGENKMLIASYGTFSTGISINNIHNIYLAESYKSEIIIKQTLGRGMRKMENKEKVNIIDFVDDFTWRNNPNYLVEHLNARIDIYDKNEFEYQFYEIKI